MGAAGQAPSIHGCSMAPSMGVWGHVAAMAHMSLALPGARFPLLFSRRGKITQPRVSSGFIHIFFCLDKSKTSQVGLIFIKGIVFVH